MHNLYEAFPIVGSVFKNLTEVSKTTKAGYLEQQILQQTEKILLVELSSYENHNWIYKSNPEVLTLCCVMLYIYKWYDLNHMQGGRGKFTNYHWLLDAESWLLPWWHWCCSSKGSNLDIHLSCSSILSLGNCNRWCQLASSWLPCTLWNCLPSSWQWLKSIKLSFWWY